MLGRLKKKTILPDPLRASSPYSLEAEQSVLAALLVDNTLLDQVTDLVSQDDFYLNHHRKIFSAILDLAERRQPYDITTVKAELITEKGDPVSQDENDDYLYDLVRSLPTTSNIRSYAKIVRERSTLRKIIHVASDIAASAYSFEERSVESILDNAEQKLFELSDSYLHLSNPSQGVQAVTVALRSAFKRIEQHYHNDSIFVGLPTGFADFDILTSGLQPTDLVVLAARPSMGKSALAMNIAENIVVNQGKPVLIFSMEMSNEALALRLLSSLARIDQKDLRSGEITDKNWPRLLSAMKILSKLPLFIDPTPNLSPTEIRARTRRLTRENGDLGLVVIDYLQLMRLDSPSENRNVEMSMISRSIKALAKEMNIPILALSQLNRSLELRADKRPIMSDLRESGAIEQDADLILFIYRDEVYNSRSSQKGVAELIIAKHRNGPIGKCLLTFLDRCAKFENYAPPRDSDESEF